MKKTKIDIYINDKTGKIYVNKKLHSKLHPAVSENVKLLADTNIIFHILYKKNFNGGKTYRIYTTQKDITKEFKKNVKLNFKFLGKSDYRNVIFRVLNIK